VAPVDAPIPRTRLGQPGLRYNGRRRVHHADSFMARVAAELLAAHLEHSGFMVKTEGRPEGNEPIRRAVNCPASGVAAAPLVQHSGSGIG
jgi:hypothetical protein